VRLREEIGKQACTQPVAHVAKAAGVGPRFVEECFQSIALQALERIGLSMDEHLPLHTPPVLGIDEYARRKGHRYDTILCDLEARQVLLRERWPQTRRGRSTARTGKSILMQSKL
jgi:hypothetical protein